MRITWCIILFIVGTFTATGQKSVVTPGINMAFEKEHIPLGKVKKGDKVSFDYIFTNKGTESLKIEIVSGCECTTLDWPRKQIWPGEKAVINVIFDSTEKEESEVVEVDITLENVDPETGGQYFKILTYSFDLIK